MVRWNGKIKPGREVDTCLNTPDIMPTLLGMMNLPVPDSVEGMNLSPLVLGENAKNRSLLLCKGWDIRFNGKTDMNGEPYGINDIRMRRIW